MLPDPENTDSEAVGREEEDVEDAKYEDPPKNAVLIWCCWIRLLSSTFRVNAARLSFWEDEREGC